MSIIKSPEEIEKMAQGGKILATIINQLRKEVRPGISTKELNRLAESLILKSGGKCSFKGYQGFPACLCTSINEEIVHALPSSRILSEGDIISLDLGIFYNGYHADMAVTLPVGEVSAENFKLIEVAKRALVEGIGEIKPGKTIGDIGSAIQEYVQSQGFEVVRELCGHGIGKKLHEPPQILNYGKKGVGEKIKQGMILCLEPMVTAGSWRIKKAKDNYGFESADGSYSSHFEHTVAVLESGGKILTVLK